MNGPNRTSGCSGCIIPKFYIFLRNFDWRLNSIPRKYACPMKMKLTHEPATRQSPSQDTLLIAALSNVYGVMWDNLSPSDVKGRFGKNVVGYWDDGADFSKLGSDTRVTTPVATRRIFQAQVQIGDITAVNGRPAKRNVRDERPQFERHIRDRPRPERRRHNQERHRSIQLRISSTGRNSRRHDPSSPPSTPVRLRPALPRAARKRTRRL